MPSGTKVEEYWRILSQYDESQLKSGSDYYFIFPLQDLMLDIPLSQLPS
jgi:hypothetical protein